MSFDRKAHWEHIYNSKQLNEVSWYEPTPETSLSFFREFNTPLNSRIIDIGGGDSFLVDYLLSMGYTNITVLDISEGALNRAKARLGEKAELVKWIVADAAIFTPTEKYDIWHDRAAFHFLTNEPDIESYILTIERALNKDGRLIVGTFSENGPTKCSGIEIRQYSEQTLSQRLEAYFQKIKCITVDHLTPFNTLQNFVFCSFKLSV
jgi:ubiquinone/menaquinone biosynthesis C-methylase UbiE